MRREGQCREESESVLVDTDGYNSGSGSSSGSGLVSSFFSFPIILARDDKQETKTRKDMNEKE